MWNRHKISKTGIITGLAISFSALSGCMDWNIYETTRPAVTEQYRKYLSDRNYRNQFDESYTKSRNSLLEDGFNNPSPHLFGDASLEKRGITRVKEHKYSKY